MNAADFLHEEPPAYGGGGKTTRIIGMNWNEMNVQCREEICRGAAISKKLADNRWEDLARWIRLLLADSYKRRTRGKTRLGGEC